jgi:hypothetical protein
LRHADLSNWKNGALILAPVDIADNGNDAVVPPPAVEKLPAPYTPPDVRFVEPNGAMPTLCCVMPTIRLPYRIGTFVAPPMPVEFVAELVDPPTISQYGPGLRDDANGMSKYRMPLQFVKNVDENAIFDVEAEYCVDIVVPPPNA